MDADDRTGPLAAESKVPAIDCWDGRPVAEGREGGPMEGRPLMLGRGLFAVAVGLEAADDAVAREAAFAGGIATVICFVGDLLGDYTMINEHCTDQT